jgi:DNA primase
MDNNSIHFPKEFLDEIVSKNSIIELAQEYFELTKVGSIYQTNCIHGDRDTKSLTFYPNTNSFYCFGCHAGAADVTGSSDVIAFVAWVENMPWKDAVVFLAKRCGTPLPEKVLSEEEKQLQVLYEQVREKNVSYWDELSKDEDITKWFIARGIDQELIDEWRLGSHNGKPVYAVIDDMGRTCGFSTRRKPTEEEGPKYKNSNESPVFKKGTLLYGLHRIKRLIRKTGYLIIVEGFNDVIILQKYGVPAVAIMGTSLTDDQITLIKKYTSSVILFLDGDDGGYANASRLIDKLERNEVQVRVMDTPGLDPDDLALVKKEGTKSFIECTAMLAGQYKISRLVAKYNELHVLAGKKLVKDLLGVLGHVIDTVEKELYIN